CRGGVRLTGMSPPLNAGAKGVGEERHSACWATLRMHRLKILLVIVAAASIGSGVWTFNRIEQSHCAELPLTSDAYRLDRIYRSMEGPMSVQSDILLGASEKTPVQWITGIETQVVDATDGKRISQEYFCHSN